MCTTEARAGGTRLQVFEVDRTSSGEDLRLATT